MAGWYEQYLERAERKKKEEEEAARKQALAALSAGGSNNAITNNSGSAVTTPTTEAPKNVGGLWGGAQYLGQSFLNGVVRGIEGIVDYTVGGIANIFGEGGREFSEKLMTEDWYNYNAAAEKYNPNGVMKFAGDVVGGIGQGVFSIGTGLLIGVATGGAAFPAIIGGTAVSGVSAAGTAVSNAAKNTENGHPGLDAKDWAYGSSVGVLEAGIELASGGVSKLAGGVLGKISGEIGGELAETITKQTAKKIVRNSVGKELLGEMAGEALEEGLSTFLDPYVQRATGYDVDAENASIGDITYSAVIGGLSGGITSGVTSAIKSGIVTKRGADIASNSQKTADLLRNASVISGYEDEKQTGNEVFEAVKEKYNAVVKSLETTGGVAKTEEQKEMLGELDMYVSSAAMQPAIVNSAKGVALNAEAYAESLNTFYAKTGTNQTVTAADLTAGLALEGDSKTFVRSVQKALKNNSLLRDVVVNNALGQMEMDSIAYADSIFGNTRISAIATQENINRFVESADAETIESVGRALGVDMRTVTPEELAASIKQFRDSGAAALYEEGYSDVKSARMTEAFEERLPGADEVNALAWAL